MARVFRLNGSTRHAAMPPSAPPAPALALALALALAPAPADGQISIFASKNLDFGILTPGAPLTVLPDDGQRRGELELLADGEVTIVVDVPAAMTSMTGRSLPLYFESGDLWLRFRKGDRTVPFAPGLPVTIRIPRGQGGVFVWIGGTADPPARQQPGRYSATLTVRVIAPGT